MIKRVKTKKNVVPVSANLEEKGPHIGNFLNNFLQGNKDSSCSSALRGENYPETSSEPAPNLFRGQVFEVGKRAHFTFNPSSYINMHGGAKDFSVEAR